MRLRRCSTWLVPGALAVGVLAAGTTVGYAQSAGSGGSIEIVDVASTATISNALQQLAQIIPSGYASHTGSYVPNGVVGGAPTLASTGDTELVASVLQSSDAILNPSDNESSTERSGTGNNLVLAQFN